ncbi:hypothetical protein NPX13_g5644 [Xylaria arbuscula]|uniref:Uncharacterized protein n=1 Tax=Xylaria arbuscula TaxID=114810 RepID=A0A9W8NE37_9PEZI|nr:hypothetical protein NPX13_g5644 [Xylaria arbuscula]
MPPEPTAERSRSGPLFLDHIGNHDNPYAALKSIDTLLLIDDSDSMQKCWDEVGDIIRIIAPICIEHDADGIDIEFVNHRARGYILTNQSGYKHIGFMKGRLDMHDNVAGIYHSVKPKGKCRLDKRLASILNPYVDAYETHVKKNGLRKLPVPLNVIVITDMDWDEEDDTFGTILRLAGRLDSITAPPFQAGVQFFRVGDAGRGVTKDKIESFDDRIWKEKGVRDIVDMTTWTGAPGELSPKGILKVLLGAVRRSVDYTEV